MYEKIIENPVVNVQKNRKKRFYRINVDKDEKLLYDFAIVLNIYYLTTYNNFVQTRESR